MSQVTFDSAVVNDKDWAEREAYDKAWWDAVHSAESFEEDEAMDIKMQQLVEDAFESGGTEAGFAAAREVTELREEQGFGFFIAEDYVGSAMRDYIAKFDGPEFPESVRKAWTCPCGWDHEPGEKCGPDEAWFLEKG